MVWVWFHDTLLKSALNLNLFYCLSDQILEERDHVRDVYTHRKGFPSPLLVLEFLDQEFAFNKRQAQVQQPNCIRLLESVSLTPKKFCSC